jgi:hypothetical protein
MFTGLGVNRVDVEMQPKRSVGLLYSLIMSDATIVWNGHGEFLAGALIG